MAVSLGLPRARQRRDLRTHLQFALASNNADKTALLITPRLPSAHSTSLSNLSKIPHIFTCFRFHSANDLCSLISFLSSFEDDAKEAKKDAKVDTYR